MVIGGWAQILAWSALGWMTLGGCVGLLFLLRGIDRVDPAARGAYAVRPLLMPGLALLWPLVLWRWHRLTRTGGG